MTFVDIHIYINRWFFHFLFIFRYSLAYRSVCSITCNSLLDPTDKITVFVISLMVSIDILSCGHARLKKKKKINPEIVCKLLHCCYHLGEHRCMHGIM